MDRPNVQDLKDRQDISGLIAALTDEDWVVRMVAADALDTIARGPHAGPPWYDASGGKADSRSIDPLMAALKDEHSDVRQYAASALGSVVIRLTSFDPRVIEPLIVALRDEILDVRKNAAEALSRILTRWAGLTFDRKEMVLDEALRARASTALEEFMQPNIEIRKNDPDRRCSQCGAWIPRKASAVSISAEKDEWDGRYCYVCRKMYCRACCVKFVGGIRCPSCTEFTVLRAMTRLALRNDGFFG